MVVIRKFLFETSFDPAAPQRAPEPEEIVEPEEPVEELPPPPTFSEEELAAAREESFAAGHAAGVAEAEAATERLAARALDGIANRLPELFAAQERTNQVNAANAARVAAAMVRKLLPSMVETHGLAEIENLVIGTLQSQLDQPRIVVRLHPELADPLRARIDAVATAGGFDGRLVILPDTGIAPGDCRLEWTDGGAERDTAALIETVDELVETHLAGAGGALLSSGQPAEG